MQRDPPPPLPEFRVVQSRLFQTTGVDFAGPLHVRSLNMEGTTKVWLCLYTCCATRAVHLDLVPDMTATSFLRNFKRFTARRGVPSRMISKPFKSAATTLHAILENPEARSISTNSTSTGSSTWRRHHIGEGYLSA